jgi:hypothetical protein
LPRRNYQFEKRQKDLAKKAKKEEKRLRRLDRSTPPSADEPGTDGAVGEPTDEQL